MKMVEREEQFQRATGGFFDERAPRAEDESKDLSGRPGPTWRAWVISILVAIVLSVTVTLLLGGSFRFTGGVGSDGCGQGSDCCPPQEAGK
jgi:hypothetical protein